MQRYKKMIQPKLKKVVSKITRVINRLKNILLVKTKILFNPLEFN